MLRIGGKANDVEIHPLRAKMVQHETKWKLDEKIDCCWSSTTKQAI